jgi:hypothetical protein
MMGKKVSARNNFKVAFYAEFRGDVQPALKYYTLAYYNIRDIPRDNSSVMELKVMADFVNFKVFLLPSKKKKKVWCLDPDNKDDVMSW